MATAQPALHISRLTKTIAGREILTSCDLTVAPGEICAIVGPNGAGKTTLFKTIVGLAFPTSGTITILGHTLSDATRDGLLSRIGTAIEAPEFHPAATARTALGLHFDLLGITSPAPVDELLDWVGLTGAADTPVTSFSLGMKQRLALARAIGHRPELVVLDEPANGLDPTGIADLRELLASLAQQGTTIVIASHILTELERTAHTVAVLTAGRLGRKQDIRTVLDGIDGGLEAFYRDSVTGKSR
ncbi:ATP-binding cassette domain-containing protein [Micrococcus terreus]|uniref:ATP-binding cassette domain-containing protein n=1 Tax=Micrococcus terreus TaxID=574650 RepID=UPI0023F9CB18|nr:ATP-binding cassette domain-containing protein [Micrococcus terreus]